jgi:hypothetical protein
MERDKTYSIGRVANMVGVPKYKLRHWCDRYLGDLLGEHELSVLLGQTSMEQYSELTGLSRRGFYRRLSHARPVMVCFEVKHIAFYDV